jgi:uncharacterized protein (TIGR02118 family)
MSREAFQAYWRDVHAPLVVAELSGMRRYVQAHVLPDPRTTSQPFCDGLPQAWFDSLEVYPLGAVQRPRDERPPGRATADLANFAGPSPSSGLVTREVVIVE